MTDLDNKFDSILIIDDNLAIHGDFAKIFSPPDVTDEFDSLEAELFGDEIPTKKKRTEFKLQFASQGKAGLQVLQDSAEAGVKFGVAFVDMRMPPGWDGVETIEHLWKVDPDLQVVICTAYSDRSWDEIFDRLGQTDKLLILKKPFDEIEVVQLATSLSEKRRLLEMSRAREENLQDVVINQGSKLIAAQVDAGIIIDSMSNVLVCLDEDGFVTRWNLVAEDILGIPAQKAIGISFDQLPIRWVDSSFIDSAMNSGSIVKQQKSELSIIDSSGNVKMLEATVCPILNDATSMARLLVATDVTMQRSIHRQLDQALRMESVGQLAAGVAHEINTPMQYIGDNVRFVSKSLKKLDPILDCLHMLADPDVTDDQLREVRNSIEGTIKPSKIKSSLKQIPDALNDSIKGVVSVSKIVAAMKEFSHPGSVQKSPTCLNHILKSTITVAKNEWKYVADLETEFDEELIKIDALPGELNQAFLNIVVNAAHAVGDRVAAKEIAKGLIRISTKNAGNNVEVMIQDNGGGIPAKARDKVFEPFFTTKDVGKGTGQGLAIAFAVIVKKHGGNISFTVKEGEGTTFKIVLPREVEPAGDPPQDKLEIFETEITP